MNCKQCGAEIEDDAKVCGKCGAQQETAQKNADGKCVSMRWKIFACVKTALLLIMFVFYILQCAKAYGFIGRPKGMSLQEFWVEREYKSYEMGKQYQMVLGEDVTVEIPEPEVVEYFAKEKAAREIKFGCKVVGATFVIIIILLIPTFLIFRGKKSKVLSFFDVLTSIFAIPIIIMGFIVCLS